MIFGEGELAPKNAGGGYRPGAVAGDLREAGLHCSIREEGAGVTLTPLDSALRLAEIGFRLIPLKPLSKRPAISWNKGGEIASNDPAQLEQWERELGPGLNWGIPTGWRNGLVVIDLDSPEAEDWWESRWLDQGVVVTTPRGGKHIYYAYDGDLEIQSNTSKHNGLFEHVDVRADGGYVLAPGSRTSPLIDTAYGDGVYETVGGLDALASVPSIPDALLEMLPLRQHFKRVAPTGPQVSAATPGEQRAIQQIVDTLENLPRPWFEGAGWDTTVFGMACWLWRMVRSPEYAMDESTATTILLTHSPTDEAWTGDDVLAKWESAEKQTVGQFAESPSTAPHFVDLEDALESLPREWEDYYWNSTERKRLKEFARSLYNAAVPVETAHTLVFHAKANTPRKGTWYITQDVYEGTPEVIIVEPGAVVPQQDEERSVERPTLNILTDAERELVNSTPNFIDRYIYAAKVKLGNYINESYYEANAWSILSNTLGKNGVLYTTRGKLFLNIWVLILGPSASGKGLAKAEWQTTISNSGMDFADVSLGGNASPEALQAKLLDRDDEVSLFWTDEASRFFKDVHANGSYTRGLRELVTDVYDGKVYPMLRRGQEESETLNKAADQVVFNMWLNGTWDGITREIDETDFASGFMGRFIYAVGHDIDLPEEMRRRREASEFEITYGAHPLIASIGSSIEEARVALLQGGPFRRIGWTDEASDLFLRAETTMARYAKNEGGARASLLLGISNRLGDQTHKCAALHAMSEGRTRIEASDALIAIRSLERWWMALVDIRNASGAAPWRRDAEEVYDYIRARKGVTDAEMKRAFRNMTNRDLESARERLVSEQRIGVLQQSGKGDGGARWIALS